MHRRPMRAADVRCREGCYTACSELHSAVGARVAGSYRKLCHGRLDLASAVDLLWRCPARPSHYGERFIHMDSCAPFSLGFVSVVARSVNPFIKGLGDLHYRACAAWQPHLATRAISV